MTKEMARALLKQYTRIMTIADRMWDKGDTDSYDEYLREAFTLDRVINELGYTFKKSFEGNYVIVEM